jgi:hypothetical protein
MVVVLAMVAFASGSQALAQEPQADPPGGVAGKDRISVVVVLKAGESKELTLATWCTVGITRSSGLEVGELKNGHFVTQIDKVNRGQFWRQDGLVVEVPGWEEAIKSASLPEYAALKEQGIDVFQVKVTAASDGKPGLHELHIQDATCGGTCRTDLRVLVLAP